MSKKIWISNFIVDGLTFLALLSGMPMLQGTGLAFLWCYAVVVIVLAVMKEKSWTSPNSIIDYTDNFKLYLIAKRTALLFIILVMFNMYGLAILKLFSYILYEWKRNKVLAYRKSKIIYLGEKKC